MPAFDDENEVKNTSLDWRQMGLALTDEENTSWSGFKPGNSSSVADYYTYKPVRRGRVKSPTFTVLCHKSHENKDGYVTEALAKAACECHYATGKWDEEK